MNRTALASIVALALLAPAVGRAQSGDGDAAALRASGQAGEQVDGYLGVVAAGTAELRAQVAAINIKRRAYYTDLAGKRGATVSEVAATTGCELIRTKVAPGMYYRSEDGRWRQHESGSAPVLPAYCG